MMGWDGSGETLQGLGQKAQGALCGVLRSPGLSWEGGVGRISTSVC